MRKRKAFVAKKNTVIKIYKNDFEKSVMWLPRSTIRRFDVVPPAMMQIVTITPIQWGPMTMRNLLDMVALRGIQHAGTART